MTIDSPHDALRAQVEELWEGREGLTADDPEAVATIHAAIDLLDTGAARVASLGSGVVVNEWLKLAILLLFQVSQMETIEMGAL
ncbi:MAG: hypothetical protein Ct9H300mP12_17870 [Acidimicrobiales bacterium]|nr:MAG: hypothetical protein Ct9H300mP12_17870 [Acidimicrobiales bacterium]